MDALNEGGRGEVPAPRKEALNLHGVRFSHVREKGASLLFDGLDLTVHAGEFLVMLGPSGSGKSTLLRLIAGLARPQQGQVLRQLRENTGQRGWSIVFQAPRLMSWRRVVANVELGLEGLVDEPFERRARAEQALNAVGLEGLGDRWPHQLSGGQKQRVAIARAIAVEPSLLLMDEPFSALDGATRTSLQELVRGLWQKLGITVVFVTHDRAEAVALGTRFLELGADQPVKVVLDTRDAGELRAKDGVVWAALARLAR